MADSRKIFCVNFGSTSTKIGAFEDEEAIFLKSYDLGSEEYPKKFANLDEHQNFADQLFRKVLEEHDLSLEDFDIFVSRGGGQVFIESGAYQINEKMIEDTYKIGGEGHPGKLGPRLAYAYSKELGKPAYIVNGPSVDEYMDVARLTGYKEINRCSRIHTLNQKEVAYRYAAKVGKDYRSLNLIVCHMGGGISVTAHRQGYMIDSNDIIEGEGPMSPTRSGAIPVMPLIEMAYSGKYTKEEMILKTIKNGGLMAHLNTGDLREVESMIGNGDKYAELVMESMVYQIAKFAGSMAVALEGKIDAILLTGGMSKSGKLCEMMEKYLGWLAPIEKFPGEFEMQALASGIIRVLNGEDAEHEYTGVDVWTGFNTEQ
ncbi:MAG: butyrate kinase [Mogibacterium sp.]|nr:butyrate kinase [Mogibacterium sp.]